MSTQTDMTGEEGRDYGDGGSDGAGCSSGGSDAGGCAVEVVKVVRITVDRTDKAVALEGSSCKWVSALSSNTVGQEEKW